MTSSELESVHAKRITAASRPLYRVLSGGRAIFLLLSVGLCILLGLEWFRPYYFSWDDNVMAFLPWRIFNYRSLMTSGEVPWINFHQFLGHEHYVAGQTGVLYWPNYVATLVADKVLGRIWMTIEVEMFLHFLAGLVATYAFFRIIKISVTWSVYGSLLSLTLPFWLSISKNWCSVGYSYFYFPFWMACLEAYLQSGARRYLILSAVAKALYFYEGNVHFICIYLLGEAIYVVHRCRGRERVSRAIRDLVWYVFSNVVAVVIALPQVIPMWMAIQQTAHRAKTMPMLDSLKLSMHLWQWVQAQWFQFHERIIFNTGSSLYYLGGCVLLPVIMIFLCRKGWLASKKNVGLGLLWLTLLALLLCTPANVILRVLPVFDRLRWPFKWYLWCAFGYSALFTLVAYHLDRHRVLARGWIQALFTMAIVSNIGVLVLPMTQKTFSKCCINPEVFQLPDLGLKAGRSQPYRISSYNRTSLVESRTFNFASLLGSQAFAGYDPLVARQVFDAVGELNYESVIQDELTQSKRDDFNQWSVRYLFTMNSPALISELQAFGGMRFVGVTASGLALIENTQARPYASMESEPSKALPVHFGVNHVDIEVAGHSGPLILTLIQRPGWFVRFDKGDYQPVIDSTKLGQMRLQIPPHVDTVTVRYWPPLFLEMVWVTAVLLGILVVAWIVSVRYKMRSAAKSE